MADETNDKPAESTPKKAAPRKAKAKRYKLLAEVTYDGKMPGKGKVVDDIPEEAAEWLLKHNYIQEED